MAAPSYANSHAPALYNVALLLFVPLIWVYWANKHTGPELWYVGGAAAVRWLGMIGMGVAFVLAVVIRSFHDTQFG
jgi:hypothetical protein